MKFETKFISDKFIMYHHSTGDHTQQSVAVATVWVTALCRRTFTTTRNITLTLKYKTYEQRLYNQKVSFNAEKYYSG